MVRIETFVFMDLETSGLPVEERNKTKITEISLIAVKRDHLLDTRAGAMPRVQHKVTLCLNPRRLIYPSCSEVTGLCNDLLEYEPHFNKEVFTILDTFLNILTKPVCFIAQNGYNFDYPILKNHLIKLGVNFSDDLLCADSFFAFYNILEVNKGKSSHENSPSKDTIEMNSKTEQLDVPDSVSMQKINETTPKKQVNRNILINKNNVRRRFPWSEKPKESYKLKDIHERLLNRPAVKAHRAENDCILALECSVAVGEEFVKYVDEHHMKFTHVKAMEVGVPLGSLLLVTGALWGCTNPFIKQGTKGLRQVHADTRLGQAYAEILFLLGNWRYVLPWLINQAGSLVYLAAVQRAPLSLTVPVANSLSFAFTAITGAVTGIEERLDKGSILGICLIGLGTGLCCLDIAE